MEQKGRGRFLSGLGRGGRSLSFLYYKGVISLCALIRSPLTFRLDAPKVTGYERQPSRANGPWWWASSRRTYLGSTTNGSCTLRTVRYVRVMQLSSPRGLTPSVPCNSDCANRLLTTCTFLSYAVSLVLYMKHFIPGDTPPAPPTSFFSNTVHMLQYSLKLNTLFTNFSKFEKKRTWFRFLY